MQSTDQGLKPIPPAATQIGDPNGHHEITEPNFSATKPCRGCSPVIEITATGWLENPVGEQHGSAGGSATDGPIKATVTAGPSNILINQEPSGDNFVIGDSTTLTPGQTVTIDDTPIAIQTSEGRTEVIVGTAVVPLQHDDTEPSYADNAEITAAPTPLPPVLTIGTSTITANDQTQYIVADQTLVPGGPVLTVSGTTLSLAPSATALIINGETTVLTPLVGGVYTTVVPAALTFNNHVYTTNRAGWIIMGQGTTLIPGGSPVTIDGTTLSLEHSGTAVIVQGTTSALQPVTTIVTLTRGPGSGVGNGNGNAGLSTNYGYAYPTEKPIPGSASMYSCTSADGWLGGIFVLVWWSLGYFAIRL